MQVRYQLIVPADCTSDPHLVGYADIKTESKRLKVMFDDIISVCDSDMVMGVRWVGGKIGAMEYSSDHYDNSDLSDGRKGIIAKGPMAVKHKIAGMYWFMDARCEAGQHLRPGLSGIKDFAKLAIADPKGFDNIKIGVTWAFAGDSSCSDYIEINDGDGSCDKHTVNYGSQDWWISNEGYLPWCDQMAKFLNREFPHANP